MCSSCGAPGKSTSGRGKMGSWRTGMMKRYLGGREQGAVPPGRTTALEATNRGFDCHDERTAPRSPKATGAWITSPRPRVFAGGPNSGLRHQPKPSQRSTVGAVAKLLEGALANLANTFPRDSHQRADLFEGHAFGAFFESIIEVKDLALAWRQIFPQDPVDALPHQL